MVTLVHSSRGRGVRIRLSVLHVVGSIAALLLILTLSGCSGTLAPNLSGGSSQLIASASSVSFGSVAIGQTASLNVTVMNQGKSSVQVSQVSVSGQSFSANSQSSIPTTIAANGSLNLTIQFNPTSTGTATGQLTVMSNADAKTSTAVNLNGTGVPSLTALSCTNSSITGAGAANCTVTLNQPANSGGLSVNLSSGNTAVTVPLTVTVPAGANSTSFTATASPVSTAQTVTLTASAGGVSETFALQLGSGGASGATLSVNATTLAFGDVALNTSATQSVTLSSTGTSPVTVSGATINGSTFTASGATFPVTLNPNQTVTLSVQFTPTATGAVTGSLTIASNSGTGATTVISLTGTGASGSASGQVTLTWDAPVSSPDPVAGYNIFRSPSGASSYQQLNSSVVTGTSYTDSTVQAGQSYDYVVLSADASGVESGPSNIASAAIQ